ncbi:MAG: response regulator transcription factor [Oscillospiraceae bacterium]|nr:response regulator transcription factor [Oscillospiraceae bacterium]
MDRVYKVIIVDDEMISRGFMELLIKPSKHYEVMAALPFAKDALLWCQKNTPPDLIIMDVMMEQGIDGLTAAAQLKAEYPQTKLLLVTSMADADWLQKAKAAKIESFWFKTYSTLSLLDVMDKTVAGESVYPEEAPAVMLGCLPASELTKQQRALLRHLTEGLSNREIAERMYLSPNTVKDYLDDLMDITGIHSRTALVAKASRLGVVISEKERLNQSED